ncbi:DUF4190 domain-containing protein [Luteimonas dalianensis]|uniref:DUF4190 domain-containing protein n=1 Tax=Luteimonas dalianensis TaxID=1148196 RepID=UPI003BF0C95E
MNVQHRQTSALAIISLVSGILGVLPVPLLASVVAVVTGHLARAEIRRAPERHDGDGMAVAGLVLGYLMLGLWLLGVMAVLFFLGGLAWLGLVL